MEQDAFLQNSNFQDLIQGHQHNENLDAKNASMEFDDKNIKPTFIFRMGIPGSSYGIEIAQRMGLESEIISNATNNLSNKSFNLVTISSGIIVSRINALGIISFLYSKYILSEWRAVKPGNRT